MESSTQLPSASTAKNFECEYFFPLKIGEDQNKKGVNVRRCRVFTENICEDQKKGSSLLESESQMYSALFLTEYIDLRVRVLTEYLGFRVLHHCTRLGQSPLEKIIRYILLKKQ